VKAGTTPTSPLDTWQYTYDPRGLRSTVTKPNGNVTTQTYHEDGLLRTLVEKTSGANGAQLVSSHSLRYTPDGDRSQDVEKVDQPGTSNYLDQASAYKYSPSRKLSSVEKTGAEKGDNESYVYDAAGNVTSQTIGATTSTMTYDRNRLVKTVSGATTLNHRYDPFGRSTTTDAGVQVVEQNAYDGYDRLVRQQKFDSAGTAVFTKLHTFDPFDRVTSQAEKVGTAQSITTRYTFVGLADQIAIEERKDTAGVFKVTKSYAYGAAGENLSLTDTPINTTTSKKSFYGTNPHSDVETLTDATGQTTSTYRYTAYGQPDKIGTTGEDAITGNPNQDADIVNPYRFNSKRINGATGTYDMGFREYNPSLNRFLSRDHYDGALKDMALGSDPWNSNRYAFAGGNPVTGVELDGHCAMADDGGCDTNAGYTGPVQPQPTATTSTAAVPNNIGQEINESMGLPAEASPQQQAIRVSQLGINPATAGFNLGAEELARTGLYEGLDLLADISGIKDTKTCIADFEKTACAWTAASVTPAKAIKLGKLADNAADACRKNSFNGGTLVLMADGSKKPIKDIELGDEVLATDPETGERGPRKVTRLWVHTDTLLELEVDGGVLTTTEDHPFWNATDRQFQRADQLDAGDQLLSDDGQLIRVIGIRPSSQHIATAYNLTVDDIHTYYVVAGNTPVLVHNSDCTKGKLSDPLPRGMNNKIASAYDDVKAGRLPSHGTYSGREYQWWAGSKEYRVPGRPDTDRILEKELPNGIKVYGWTSTHYTKIQHFSAPHFPDSGW
jgi:RHS repeat-associated protein